MIATLILSASSRPIASWTSPRGRSSRSAWLTWARAPVSASETSRFAPGWPLNAALCIPGASSNDPKTSPSTATISPWPAVPRRRPSPVYGERSSGGGASGARVRAAGLSAAGFRGARRRAAARAAALLGSGSALASTTSPASSGNGGSTCSADSRIGGSFGSSGGFSEAIRSGSR